MTLISASYANPSFCLHVLLCVFSLSACVSFRMSFSLPVSLVHIVSISDLPVQIFFQLDEIFSLLLASVNLFERLLVLLHLSLFVPHASLLSFRRLYACQLMRAIHFVIPFHALMISKILMQRGTEETCKDTEKKRCSSCFSDAEIRCV